MVTSNSTITLSPLIRGESLKGDDVLLTLADGGILVSPYQEGEVQGNDYAREKFSSGRLYLPLRFLKAANIKRWVTVKIQPNGNLLLVPGEQCMICGSRKNLYSFDADRQICKECLKKANRS